MKSYIHTFINHEQNSPQISYPRDGAGSLGRVQVVLRGCARTLHGTIECPPTIRQTIRLPGTPWRSKGLHEKKIVIGIRRAQPRDAGDRLDHERNHR